MGDDNHWRIAPVLGMCDVDMAVDYYARVLGFECPGGITGGVVPGEGGVYAVVRREGVEIHLQIRRRDPVAGRQRIESDVYAFVPDVDALYAEVCSRGARIHRPLEDSRYGLRDFVVVDLEGHRLVFGSPVQ